MILAHTNFIIENFLHLIDADRMAHEPRCEKTGLRGFRPGSTQTGLYNYTRWLEACNFVYRKSRYCTICVAKTKALISFVVTAKLICIFVFAYAKSRFSHDAAHIVQNLIRLSLLGKSDPGLLVC